MEINVINCFAWSGNLQSPKQWKAWANGDLSFQASSDLPPLKEIPAMQRRRLSSFAKITLDCLLKSSEGLSEDVPCVFASRHGDLHRTAKLIEDVACGEDLSPTHFGLSVHNAVSGLYSIFSKNKQPMTAIASGEDTFMMALLDAYGKLKSGKYNKVFLVYSDEIVPTKYQQYVSDEEQSVAVAMLLTLEPIGKSIHFDFGRQKSEVTKEFQPFSFLSFYFGEMSQRIINSPRYWWKLSK